MGREYAWSYASVGVGFKHVAVNINTEEKE